jgi:ABC-type branched-subunit amino acid transport system ATPase component
VTSPALLEVSDLTKRFAGVCAVDAVSFAVARGRVHAVIGPNGAGKTTLFNLITGFEIPDGGEIGSTAAASPACRRTAWPRSASAAPFRRRRSPPISPGWRTSCSALTSGFGAIRSPP